MGGNKESRGSKLPKVSLYDMQDYSGVIGVITVAAVSLIGQNIESAIPTIAIASSVNVYLGYRIVQEEKKSLE